MTRADRSPVGTWPSVTAVIPTRDRLDLLRGAVSSVLAQDYPGRIDCAVVFDQTEVVRPWLPPAGDRTMRCLRNDRRAGLAGARNTGVLAATGELVAFCDDDDEWLPAKLRLQVERLQRDPHAAVVSGGIRIRYGEREVSRTPASVIHARDLLRSRVTALHSSTLLFRRSALLEIGLVDETLPGSYAEDYDLLLRSARLGPILSVPAPVAMVRWHRDSWFAHRWQTVAEALTVLLRKHPELRDDRAGLARIYGRLAFAHAAAGRSKIAREWARRSITLNWRERRAYAAYAVSTGLLRSSTLMRLANARGRGI